MQGFTDKGLTEELAGKLELEARLRTTGLIDGEVDRLAAHKLLQIEQQLDSSPITWPTTRPNTSS